MKCFEPQLKLFAASGSSTGALAVHICSGPFGCDGSDHPHSFQAIAA
jgi:hypothetical protein